MNTIALVIFTVVLAFGSGCARPDWIEQTLVTVDVTGTWRSTSGIFSELTLEQQGSRVKGAMVMRQASGPIISGPIDGTVAGDVLTIRLANADTMWDMTVSGDEMSGRARGGSSGNSASPVGNTRLPMTLQRVNSSDPPRWQ